MARPSGAFSFWTIEIIFISSNAWEFILNFKNSNLVWQVFELFSSDIQRNEDFTLSGPYFLHSWF